MFEDFFQTKLACLLVSVCLSVFLRRSGRWILAFFLFACLFDVVVVVAFVVWFDCYVFFLGGEFLFLQTELDCLFVSVCLFF